MRCVVGHTDGQASCIGEAFVQPAQQRTTARQDDAIVHKVSGKFRFNARDKPPQRIFKLPEQPSKRLLANFFGIDLDDKFATFGCIDALDFIIKFLLRSASGANLGDKTALT